MDAFGIGICIDYADYRNLDAIGFGDRDALVFDIDYEQGIRQSAHLLDTADTALKFLARPDQHQRFLLGQAIEGAVLRLFLKLLEPAYGAPDGLVIGEHATQPAMIDIGHFASLRLPANDLRGRAFGADEEHLLALGREFRNLLQGCFQRRNRGFEINDVNLVAGTEYVRLHLGIPVAALVTEMHASAQHFFHTYRHNCFLRVRPPHTPWLNSRPVGKGAPGTHVPVRVRH